VTVLTGSDESAAALQAWIAAATGTAGAATGARAAPTTTAAASVRVLRFRAGSDAAVVAPALAALREEHGQEHNETWPLLLVHDLVEGSGLIRQGALQEALLARDLLGPEALLLPHAFRVVVQCLDAPGLVAQNRLDPANTLGLRLDALDGLGVTTFRELDLAAACRDGSCTALSQPFPALAVELRTVRVSSSSNAGDEALARARVAVPVTGAGTLHALGFWFELQLADGGPTLSTGPKAEEEEEEGGYARCLSSYRQGAVLLTEGRVVQAGQTVQVEVVCTLSRGIDIFLVET
jgi:hypothetical protein